MSPLSWAVDGYDWQNPAANGHVSLIADSGYQPSVAVNVDGDVVLAWSQMTQGVVRLVLAERTMGVWSKLNPTVSPIPAPYLLSPAGGMADNAVAAISANGDAAVVWRQQVGPNLFNDIAIFYADRRNGQWTKPATLNNAFSLPGTKADAAHVAMNDRGDTVVTWQQPGLNPQTNMWDKQVFASVFRAGHYTFDSNWVPQYVPGSWIESPVDIWDYISSGTSTAYAGTAAIDNNGNVVVTWEENMENVNGSVIWVRHFDMQTLNWDTPQALTTPDIMASRPTVVVNRRSGELLAAWGGQLGPKSIHAFKSQPFQIGGPAWATPLSTEYISIPDYYTAISGLDDRVVPAIDSVSGRKIVAWTQMEPNIQNAFVGIFMAECLDGVNWTLPHVPQDTISTNLLDKGQEPSVAISGATSRYALITWPEISQAGAFSLPYSEFVDVSGQTQWVHPATSNKLFNTFTGGATITNVSVGLSDRGYGVVAWQQENGGVDRIYISERLPLP